MVDGLRDLLDAVDRFIDSFKLPALAVLAVVALVVGGGPRMLVLSLLASCALFGIVFAGILVISR